MTKVAVVIVNWNGALDTIDCVRSLQQIETGGARLTIVVTDNDSSDNSVVLLDAFFRSQGSARPIAPPPHWPTRSGTLSGTDRTMHNRLLFW